jgi:nicotinic acid mononucleotide adenylyltransferase
MDINKLLTDSNVKLGLIITGGGSRIISNILCKGGASKFFQFAEVPYAREFVDSVIGQPPSSKYCSVATARELAQAAYFKMINNAELDGLVMGVGITATLGYEGQREGRTNEFHVAIYTKECVSVNTYILIGTDRDGQENSVAQNFEYFLEQFILKNPYYKKFPNIITPELDASKDTLLVYSGSFNPYHEGHEFVTNLAKSSFPNAEFVYEISTSIHEKQNLDGMEVNRRISTLPKDSKVVVSDIKFFEEKYAYLMSIYPHIKKFIFVMGWDTYERVITRPWTDAHFTNSHGSTSDIRASVFVVPRPTYKNDLTNLKYKRPYVEPICLSFDTNKMNIPNISSTTIRKQTK